MPFHIHDQIKCLKWKDITDMMQHAILWLSKLRFFQGSTCTIEIDYSTSLKNGTSKIKVKAHILFLFESWVYVKKVIKTSLRFCKKISNNLNNPFSLNLNNSCFNTECNLFLLWKRYVSPAKMYWLIKLLILSQ